MIPLPELLLPLPAATLRSLLSALAPDLPLPKAATSTASLVRWLFTHPACSPSSFASLATPPKSHPFPRLLAAACASDLPRFATRDGRRAIVEAARAVGESRLSSWYGMTSPQLAIQLVLEAATASEPSVRKRARLLLQLARQRTDRDLPPRATYELLGSSPIERDPKRVEAALRRALGPRLEDVWTVVDPDGTLRIALFVRGPAEARLETTTASRDGRTPAPVGQLACDHVCIAPDGSRLRVTPSMPDTLPEYVSAFDASVNPSFTLRTVLELTSERLAALRLPPITGMELVGLRVRHPDGTRIETRGPDVLDTFAKHPAGGYADRVTLRFLVEGKHMVDAYLQLPHHLDVSDRAFEGPVRAALAALGIFAPGKLPDDARSLAPYEHGDWRWIAVVGETSFARLVDRGFLVRVTSAHVVTKENRMHGAAYVVREVPGQKDTWYALAEDPSLGARLVTPKDRVAYRLDTEKLRAAMMKDIGAVEAELPLRIAGIVDLGVVTLKSGSLRVVYAMGEPPVGWTEAIRRACRVGRLGITPVVLVPRGHAIDALGMLAIELDVQEQFGAKTARRALGRAAEVLGVESEVEAYRRYDEELVLEREAKRAWLVGVPLVLSDNGWRFVEYLATNAAKVVPTDDIGKNVSISGHPGAAARRTKTDVERQVTDCLAQAGADTSIAGRLILVEGHKGYRLGVSVKLL